ncbi:MAG: hypothetical protein IBJ17_14370 [Reyranella sp.]|nr:hypothetical protein [Reyranella sp.]
MVWLAQEPKAMRDSGGRLWDNAVAGASDAAAMNLERIRRVNIPATELPVSDL